MTGHTNPGHTPLLRRALPLVVAVTAPALLSSPAADAQRPNGDRDARVGQLAMSTYLGGLEWDEASGVATDRRNNLVVTGFTLSGDFPVVGPGADGHVAIVDTFVTKVSADRSRILWSTQLGGRDLDAATALTTDHAGNIFVAGRTGSTDFPVTGALQGRLAGRACTGEPCHDAFVAKLTSAGRVRWATYFGGSGSEEPFGITVDRAGAVYLAGATDSADLPLRRSVQRTFQSSCTGDLPCPYDAFVTKIAPDGRRVLYSTYLGGSASDVARALAVDRRGRAYVAGSTGSADFPRRRALQGGTRGEHCGPPPGEPCRQAFVVRLNRTGDRLSYSTYLGGREHDDGFGIAVDGRNRAYVTGSTASPDFPIRNAGQSVLSPSTSCTDTEPEEVCDDAFATRISGSGRRLGYSTYLGGQAEDQGLTIDVTNGRALIGGRTDSANFPTTAGVAQPTYGGAIDGFAAELGRGGRLRSSTFLGGSEADRITGITANRRGGVDVVGRTLSPDFPTVASLQAALEDDDYDTFVATFR